MPFPKTSRLKRSMTFAILLGIFIIYKILSTDKTEEIEKFVDNYQEQEAVIAEQEAAHAKWQAEQDAKDDWLIGTWKRFYNPDLNEPDRIEFNENNSATLYFPNGKSRTGRYFINRTTIAIHAKGGLTLLRDSNDAKLIPVKDESITYTKQ